MEKRILNKIMGTKITMLPLDEVRDMFTNYFKCVEKVALMTGDDLGLVIEYYDDMDKTIHLKVIRPLPKTNLNEHNGN